MKKTLGKIICAFLALTMAFGTLTAFAAEDEPIYTYAGLEYSYAGEFKEGSNTVNYSGEPVYVTFNAEKDGYYVFVHEENGFYYSHWLMQFESDEDKEITDFNYFVFSEFSENPNGMVTVYKLEAGENRFTVEWQEEIESAEKVNVSYLGAEITDIDFSAGTDYALIYGEDIYDVHFSGIDYGDSYGYAFYATDIALSFDSGKTLEFDDFGTVPCICETEIEDGVYDVEVFLDYEKTFPAQIEVHPMTYYVENVEADNPEKFINIEYYDGYGNALPYEGTYTVTLKSGEKITVDSGEPVVIPGANPNGYDIYKVVNHDKETVKIGLSYNMLYESYECTVQPATTEQNFDYMAEKVSCIFSRFKSECDYLYDDMVSADSKADTLRAFGTWISHINNNVLFTFGDIIGEFFGFIGYTVLHL